MLQLNIPRIKPQKMETDNLENNGRLINHINEKRIWKKDEEQQNKNKEKDSFRLRVKVIVQIVKEMVKIDVKMVFINIINVLVTVYY